jgi:hypothetical protein
MDTFAYIDTINQQTMSLDNTNTDVTEVAQVEMNLDEILGTPGAESVVLPEKEVKPNIFSAKNEDLSFIDNPEDEEESQGQKEPESIDDVLKDIDPIIQDEEEPETKKAGGRPKIDKSGMAEVMNKLIEKGQIVPFEDDKPIDEYSIKDFEELLEANFAERENRIRQETPVEFFEALPEELQAAAKYVADGGDDLKGLFKVLAQVEEVRELNPKKADDQEQIVREYLRATNFGTTADIEEEIEDWRDRGDLEAKALKFKPKLDKMQESVVAQKLAQQEQIKAQQQEAAKAYVHNVYTTLQPGELNGIKLDKKTQGMLYAGLVQPNYPSMSGKPTNMLGHLLEKHQYVEPNYPLIAEALWLLADPVGYRNKIKDTGKNEQVEKTVRQLKSEEARKTSSTPVVEREEKVQRRIPRNDNFFKR